MPKIKTHKGAQKRFYVTGTGNIMRRKGGSSHLRMQKSKRVKRSYDKKLSLSPVDTARIKKLIPNGVG